MEAEDDAEDGHDDEDGAYNLVDELEAAHIDAAAQLAHHQGYAPPPQQGTPKNSKIGPDVMVKSVFGQEEIKSRKETYYEEKNQRVGECEKEAAHEIAPIIGGRLILHAAQGTRGILLEQIDAECHQHHSAKYLKKELMLLYQIGDKTEAKTCEQTVDKVAERRPYACGKSRQTPLAKGALNHKHSYRPHRG